MEILEVMASSNVILAVFGLIALVGWYIFVKALVERYLDGKLELPPVIGLIIDRGMAYDVQIERCGEELVISIPWFRGTPVKAAIFMALLTLVMPIFFFIVDDLQCLIFPLFTGYVSFALFLNSTKIIVNERELIVQYGPLPTIFIRKTLSVADIKALHIAQTKQQIDWRGYKVTVFQLKAKSRSSDRDVFLIKVRNNYAEIKRIESEISRFIESDNRR